MTVQSSRLLTGAACLLIAVGGVVGCATSIAGTGSATVGPLPTTPPVDTSQPPTSPTTTSPSLPTSAPAPPSTPVVTVTQPAPRTTTVTHPPAPQGTPVTVTGTNSGDTYQAEVYATSRVTDCAAHSYGTAMIDYFEAHPCYHATRRLFTLDYGGRTVVMSTVTVDTAIGPDDDLYRWTARFERLENADGTGSVNDLLREGYRIPGAQSSIPSNEAFDVTGQDNVVVVSDAWYEHGGTNDQDPDLVAVEKDLFVTPLTTE